RRRSARLSRSARRDRGGRDRSLNAGRRQLSAPPLKDFPAGVDVWPMTARVSAGPRTALAPSRWIDRWLAACSELAELERSNPMTDAVIDEIDGRMIRVGDQWLSDFASCNYLGFDLDREIIESIPAYLQRWRTHPSWSRLLGSPALYPEIEARLARRVAA